MTTNDIRPMHAKVTVELDGLQAEVVAAALAIYASHLRRGMGGVIETCGPISGPEPDVDWQKVHAREHWATRHAVAQQLADELYEKGAV